MPGGNWLTQNKVRPGVYINFEGEGNPVGTIGERGIVTMPLQMSWGPAKQVITVEAGSDTMNVLGYNILSDQMLLVKEATKRAKTLLLYRLNEGTKATATEGTMTITARYGGVRGNDIKVVIQENVDDSALFDVMTYLEDVEMDSQTVPDIDSLENNNWVNFSGTGALAASAGISLTGGDDGNITNQEYSDYLAAIEVHDFNSMGASVTDETIKSLLVSFVKRLRDDEGKKVQIVVPKYPDADYEGVISVKNGVVLSDGTKLTAEQAVAWTAGATAAAAVNESLTYQAYDDAVDANPRYTNSEIIEALKDGEFVFTANDGRAIVEQDINTFTSFTPEKPQEFSKNRVIRVLDGLNNDYVRIFSRSYIGKVDNNDNGRNLFKAECINISQQYQNIAALQNFDPQTDITVQQGEQTDSVYVEQWVQPVDSIEKIYMDIIVGGAA